MTTAATAATRFAAPGGLGAAPCDLRADPCSLFDAASLAAPAMPAQPGDEVVLAPGHYSDVAGDLGSQNSILLDRNVSLHGEAGKPRPVITLANSVLPALSVQLEDTVSHLEIESAVAPSLIRIQGGIVEDLIARSTRNGGGIVCSQQAGVLRDSACLSSGSGGTALGLEAVGAQADFQRVIVLRNVTAVATGSGSSGLKFQISAVPGVSPPNFVVDGIGVIAGGKAADVIARGLSLDPASPESGADVEVALNHSDYANVSATNDGGGGTVFVTDPSTESNLEAVPLLAADGFHQLPGSPTVEAGDRDDLSGEHDIDGQARAIGVVPVADMGADELGDATSTAVSCSAGPLKTGEAFSCTATVTDTTGRGVPSGEPTLASDGEGGFELTPCTLVPIAGVTASSCRFDYRPVRFGSGSHTLTASYPGDERHDGSLGTAAVKIAGTGADGAPVATAPPVAPNTTLRSKPRRKTAARLATFRFASDQAGSSFQCRLDRTPFKPCRSPFKRRVKPGLHTFRVRVVNAAGLVDPTPAIYGWMVLAGRRR